jgi:hypothetical protein
MDVVAGRRLVRRVLARGALARRCRHRRAPLRRPGRRKHASAAQPGRRPDGAARLPVLVRRRDRIGARPGPACPGGAGHGGGTDSVCFWDFDDPAIPNAPRDTSAAAIAAASLLKLAALGDSRYRAAAERIVNALAERHLTQHGGLRDGCYDQHQKLATANELIWGDYFLLEALLALDGVIRPGTL